MSLRRAIQRSAPIVGRAGTACRWFAKAAGGKKGAVGSDEAFAKALKSMTQAMWAIVNTPDLTPENVSDELRSEMQVKGKTYSIKKRQQHHLQMAKLNMKIQVKNEAIAQLPAEMYEECMLTYDDVCFPLDRTVPTLTPPISGFTPGRRAR